jgi:hypothetical protein
MEPQKTTEQSLTITNYTSSLTMLADPKRFHEVLANVPAKLDKVLDRPPISSLIHAGARRESIEACLAIEITKTANALTVGGNLRQGQSLEIAIDLIKQYPHESIEDFCFCLRNGVRGKYNENGKLFRFDGVVIHEWFRQYLDEKYEAIEARLMAEKDNTHEVVKRTSSDWLELMKDAVKKSDEEAPMKTVPQSKIFMQKVMDLTEKEIEREGKERPKRQSYPSTSASEIRQRELHLEWIRENFDARTGEKLQGWIPEPEWLQIKALRDKHPGASDEEINNLLKEL